MKKELTPEQREKRREYQCAYRAKLTPQQRESRRAYHSAYTAKYRAKLTRQEALRRAALGGYRKTPAQRVRDRIYSVTYKAKHRARLTRYEADRRRRSCAAAHARKIFQLAAAVAAVGELKTKPQNNKIAA